jgi:iron(III) transport system substrate-binding protein
MTSMLRPARKPGQSDSAAPDLLARRMDPGLHLRSAPAWMSACALLLAIVNGCNRKTASPSAAAGPVVLYTSVDEPFVRPLIARFQNETGIAVTLLTDAEAAKSVGLAEKIRAERDHPRADVWWDNECFLTINLAREGILAPYDSPAAADIPAQYKDREHRWAAGVLRARVLVSSPKLAGKTGAAKQLRDLLRPEWRGRIAIARPTAGTTGGHVAALYVTWGDERADAFFRQLHDNGCLLLGGNAMVAESVARGDLIAGVCDNDDAASASAEIGKLETALPDQDEIGDGTLAIPAPVSLVTGAPHPVAATKLIDFLLSRDVDRALIDAKFAWASTRDAAMPGKVIKIDYEATAKAMPAAIRRATAILEGR